MTMRRRQLVDVAVVRFQAYTLSPNRYATEVASATTCSWHKLIGATKSGVEPPTPHAKEASMAQRMAGNRSSAHQEGMNSRVHRIRETHVRHRDYSPPLGRFIERDPIGFAAGDGNWYKFVVNCPLTHTDATGLVPIFTTPEFTHNYTPSTSVFAMPPLVAGGVGLRFGATWTVSPGGVYRARNVACGCGATGVHYSLDCSSLFFGDVEAWRNWSFFPLTNILGVGGVTCPP